MLIDHVLPLVEDFVVGFQRDPEAFAEDTDVRRDLFSALYRDFSSRELKLSIPRKDLAMEYYPDRSEMLLTPVKSAYPTEFQFDIAILDPESHHPLSKEEADTPERYARYWQQKVAVAVQIHLCKPDQDPTKYFRKLDSDLKKFQKYRQEHNPALTAMTLLLVQGDLPKQESGIQEEHGLPAQAGIFAGIVAENGFFSMVEN